MIVVHQPLSNIHVDIINLMDNCILGEEQKNMYKFTGITLNTTRLPT